MHEHHAADGDATQSRQPPEAPSGEQRRLGGLTVGDFRLPPNFRATGHSHDRPHLGVVVSGGFAERNGPTGDRTLLASDVRFSPAGDLHDIVAGPVGARCIIVEFDVERTSFASRCLPQDRRYWDEPVFSALSGRIAREVFSADPSRLCVEGLGLELLAVLGRAERPRADSRAPAWLGRVREQLHAHCTESITLDGLAAEAGVHPMHLTRAFRAHFGCSVGDYALRLRLDRAREMLVRTDLAIAAVAHETGFSDQSHLTRRMKRALGVTPHALRRSTGR